MKKVGVKHKRGIRMQTRIFVTAILFILQILFLFSVCYNLNDYFYVYVISEILAIFTVIYIVNRRSNPSYKIAWIIFILLFPIFGISVFLLWGGSRVMPFFKRKMRKCESHYFPKLKEDPNVRNRLRYEDNIHSRQADYLSRESGFPLYGDTTVEYLSPGEKFLPRFLEELEKAEKYIFIEFFIVAEGKMWNSVFEILKKKAEQGVEVKVMFDDFGSIKRQRRDFITRLQKANIKVAIFNKIKPSVNMFMNNRNHRKIVVIDGKVAVTGGINIADEYINKLKRFGYWLDCAAIIKGKAVTSFLAMFCSTWEFTVGEKIDMEAHIADFSAVSKGYVLPYCDSPLNDNNPAEGIYMQILSTAQRYVYITSPYLIIDGTMIMTLQIAAKSGIDVRIITPHIPDKWYVHPVTQYNYLSLLEAGVKIYEYTPGFIHSKLFISDDSIATIGTVNMDYRSFIMHFECGLWMSDRETVLDIKKDFENIMAVSKEIKLKNWRKSPWLLRMKRAFLHLFAPFM